MRSTACPATGLLLLALLCAPVTAQEGRNGMPPPATTQLRAGDAIRFAVRDEPTLAGEYPVNADGTVLLPLIGLVRVANEPLETVVQRVRTAYGTQLATSDVVFVFEPLMRVLVTGEARVPGVLLVDATYTVSDVLARSGGALPTAARGRVVLVRDGREYVLRRDGAATLPTVPVQSGDVIEVPRQSWLADHLPVLIGSAASVLAAAVTTLLVR